MYYGLGFKEKEDIWFCLSDSVNLRTREYFNRLKDRYGYSVSLSNLIPMMEFLFGMEFDMDKDWDPHFFSHLLDLQKNLIEKGRIDVTEIKEDLFKHFNFTRRERYKLDYNDDGENALCAIYLVVCCPGHPKFELEKNND